MKHKILFSILFISQFLFCQTDLNNVIKGGELFLSGLSILKTSNSGAKKDSKVIEIGAFAGDGMYEEHGGCPGGGVVIVIGYLKLDTFVKKLL